MPALPPIEAKTEAEFAAWCRSIGARCKKLKLDYERGFPDRTVFLPNGKIVFVELKRKGKRPSALQRQWLRWLTANGHACGWADNLNDAIQLVRAYL